MPTLQPVEMAPIDPTLIFGGGSGAAAELERFRWQAVNLSLVVLRLDFIDPGDNNRFVEMMTRYFAQSPKVLAKDVRPQVGRQVGYTEPYVEDDARWYSQWREQMAALPEGDRPYGMGHNEANGLARFFWRLGDRPTDSQFAELHADPVVPAGFEDEWAPTMNAWGERLLEAGNVVGKLTELAFDLAEGTITRRFDKAPHLLAPTGSDLLTLLSERTGLDRDDLQSQIIEARDINALAIELGLLGHIISRYHLDFQGGPAVHGSSNFPALMGWTRDNKPFQVRVPDGCVLAQYGQQMEHLFAGRLNPKGIQAGGHEVATIPATIRALQAALREGRTTVRSGSTTFVHFATDDPLEVMPRFREIPGALERYPDMLVGHHSADVIRKIGLHADAKS